MKNILPFTALAAMPICLNNASSYRTHVPLADQEFRVQLQEMPAEKKKEKKTKR